MVGSQEEEMMTGEIELTFIYLDIQRLNAHDTRGLGLTYPEERGDNEPLESPRMPRQMDARRCSELQFMPRRASQD